MSNETSMTDKIVNRHLARTLTDLEDAKCPAIFIQAVKSSLIWLRDDLNAMENERHEPIYPRP
jgi:hypothetical protein